MAGGARGDKKDGQQPQQLNPSSKAFVPGSSSLHASATAFQPGHNNNNNASSSASAPKEASPQKQAAPLPPNATTSPSKQKPAAAVPVVSAWGAKKLSDAVRAAPPPQPKVIPASSSLSSAASSKKSSSKSHSHSGHSSGHHGHNNGSHGSNNKWARGAPRQTSSSSGAGSHNKGGGRHGSGHGSSSGHGGEQRRGSSGQHGGSSGQHGGERRGSGQHAGSGHGGERRGSGHGGGGSSGHHHHHHHDRQHHHHHRQRGGSSKQSAPPPTVELFQPGEGQTSAQKAVHRIGMEDLMALRLQYLDPPLQHEKWTPPEIVIWDTPTRTSEIEATTKGPRVSGEVTVERRRKSKPKQDVVDTAPALEDCKPLEVNDETRWKSKVFDPSKKQEQEEEEDSDEEVLKKALLILNKLSLTKFDKLSDDFIGTGIGRNVECLNGAIGLIVTKAQGEPHFAGMYAALCFKLAKTPMDSIEQGEGSKKSSKKLFKKLLLTRCQVEFEEDTAHKIAHAVEGIDDKEEQQYQANLIKRNYLGHMRFIGELYKGDMIKIEIMLWCLKTLLMGEGKDANDAVEKDEVIEEEKVECFAKLMSTIGDSLDQQSQALKNAGKPQSSQELGECWKTVEIMAGTRKEEGPQVSNRVKFMLQDLIELRNRGWVKRRKEETAKTIEEIHKEVAKEEKRAARRSSSSGNLRSLGGRRSSTGDIRVMERQNSSSKPIADADGFVQVANVRRTTSATTLQRSQSDVTGSLGRSKSKQPGPPRRSTSGTFKSGGDEKAKAKKKEEPVPELKVEYLSPDECGKKATNILKEYFVAGDTDDAVLSIHELVGAGNEGSVDRGAKVVESSCLLVMEMKETEVTKMLTVLTRCIQEKKLEKESIPSGLNDPLEFLSDIEIDAPLAGTHLATIVAEFVKADAVSFDFLLNAPEYFRTDGKAAQFGCKVLKKMGGDAPDANVAVIDKLMTDDDKAAHASARELLAA